MSKDRERLIDFVATGMDDETKHLFELMEKARGEARRESCIPPHSGGCDCCDDEVMSLHTPITTKEEDGKAFK